MNLPKPSKRNSETIGGQLWHFRSERYRTSDTLGSYSNSAVIATRYSDGRTVTGSTRQRLVSVIAQRISDGDY